MATVPWRFDYILSRFLLHRSAHSSVHALDFSTHEKIKKKNERTLQKKRAFLRLDTERLSGAAEETDGATPSVDGQATSLARYRPFLLRACAAVTQLAALSSLLLG